MRRALLTVDLGFGDGGKGTVVDYLTRRDAAHTVVRFNGGAQAGHRVVTAAGAEHVFSQFGSGTLAGAATHLSHFMLVEPLAMMAEADHLVALGVAEPFRAVTIDEGALLITPFHRAINRLRELARGDARHGSCGVGVGETMADWVERGAALRVGALRDPAQLRAGLHELRALNCAKLADLALPDSEAVTLECEILQSEEWLSWTVAEFQRFAAQLRIVSSTHLAALLQRPGTVVFEAAQGVLLDEWHGFHPYTTWSTTTLANADTLLREARYEGEVQRLGLCRAYATRHGAGPFPTEAAPLARALPDARNGDHPWQQGFRVGWPDQLLLRYAREVVGPLDGLAITCLDRLDRVAQWHLCTHYEHDGQRLARLPRSPKPRDLPFQSQLTETLWAVRPVLEAMPDRDTLLACIAEATATPITLLSEGPTAEDKREIAPHHPLPALNQATA